MLRAFGTGVLEARGTRAMQIEAFFHEPTNSVAYLLIDEASKTAALIDPVLDFDQAAARVSTKFADGLVTRVKNAGLTVEWILDTHVHADHLTAMAYLKDKLSARTGIGRNVVQVQSMFRDFYNLPRDLPIDGSQFDRLFDDGERFRLGTIEIEVMHTPGHTPACSIYRAGDAAFIGDTLFMPDYGTARCDFPGGDARTLYRSIRRILALPPQTRLFTGHDYAPNGRAYAWESTVAEQTAKNVHIADKTEDEFVALREGRDRTLNAPHLILPALQVNIRAGVLPPPEPNGVRYLKIPMNRL
jgi:glyoxylase-like metal-dependent hydrolase (beta-lactamase superfamily II)